MDFKGPVNFCSVRNPLEFFKKYGGGDYSIRPFGGGMEGYNYSKYPLLDFTCDGRISLADFVMRHRNVRGIPARPGPPEAKCDGGSFSKEDLDFFESIDQLLNDEDPVVRRLAALRLAELKDPRSLPILLELMNLNEMDSARLDDAIRFFDREGNERDAIAQVLCELALADESTVDQVVQVFEAYLNATSPSDGFYRNQTREYLSQIAERYSKQSTEIEVIVQRDVGREEELAKEQRRPGQITGFKNYFDRYVNALAFGSSVGLGFGPKYSMTVPAEVAFAGLSSTGASVFPAEGETVSLVDLSGFVVSPLKLSILSLVGVGLKVYPGFIDSANASGNQVISYNDLDTGLIGYTAQTLTAITPLALELELKTPPLPLGPTNFSVQGAYSVEIGPSFSVRYLSGGYIDGRFPERANDLPVLDARCVTHRGEVQFRYHENRDDLTSVDFGLTLFLGRTYVDYQMAETANAFGLVEEGNNVFGFEFDYRCDLLRLIRFAR